MKLAICVCTCERPASLARLLGALREVDRSELAGLDLELVVVDNAPSSAARRVWEGSGVLPFPSYFEEEPRRGISFARNRGVAAALAHGADLVAFLDDDDLPRPEWLGRLVSRWRATAADLVFGTWRDVLGGRTPAWVHDAGFFRVGGVEAWEQVKEKYGVGVPGAMATCNALVTQEVLARLAEQGPVFAPEFAVSGGEDVDFFVRALKTGARFAVATDSVVMRFPGPDRTSLRGILRRCRRPVPEHDRDRLQQRHAKAKRRQQQTRYTFTAQALNIQPLDGDIGCRHNTRLDAGSRTEPDDLLTTLAQTFGDGQRRENMTSGATRHHQDGRLRSRLLQDIFHVPTLACRCFPPLATAVVHSR